MVLFVFASFLDVPAPITRHLERFSADICCRQLSCALWRVVSCCARVCVVFVCACVVFVSCLRACVVFVRGCVVFVRVCVVFACFCGACVVFVASSCRVVRVCVSCLCVFVSFLRIETSWWCLSR